MSLVGYCDGKLLTDRAFVIDVSQLGKRIKLDNKFAKNDNNTVVVGFVGSHPGTDYLALIVDVIAHRIQAYELDRSASYEEDKELYGSICAEGKTTYLAISRTAVYTVTAEKGLVQAFSDVSLAYGTGGPAFVFCKQNGVSDEDTFLYVSTVDLLVSGQYDAHAMTDLNEFSGPLDEAHTKVVDRLKNHKNKGSAT